MKKKIKVLFILPSLHSGGAEKVTINLIKILDKNFYDVHLVLLTDGGSWYDLLPDNLSIHLLKASKTIFSILKLRKLLLNLLPDIVFSTLFRSHTALDASLIGLKKPIVILRNPTSPKLVIEENNLSFIRKYFLIRAYNRATILLAQTPEMKDEMKEYFYIRKKRIEIFINPLDTESINNAIKNIENPFDVKYTNVVAAGRLSKVKAFDTLLKSFKIIVEKNQNYMLHIIGRDVGEKKYLTKIMNDLSLENNVKFWGDQSNPYKFFYYSDAYVLSSIREGLPNSVLENLYLRKPVIATRCIPFMSKLINDGYNGYLVDVGDEEALAEAILKYKTIDAENIHLLVTQSDVNKLFKKLIDENKL